MAKQVGDNTSLFKKLTDLFRTGPAIKRKVRGRETVVATGSGAGAAKSSGTLLFQKSVNHSYANVTSNAYNLADRLNRYNDFCEMEQTPEIAAALDIYAAETAAKDEKGRSLKVYSDNKRVRELLEDLFYNILNVDYNLPYWTRNLPVHKDTIIPLLDGRNITIEQLAQEQASGKENWVYAIQDGTHRTVPGKVKWCDLTRKDSELVRVRLDDESYVDCTPDHRFKLRDGSTKAAENLCSGDSLMPFYRKVSENCSINGYERVYDPASGRHVYTHRRVAEIISEVALNQGRWIVTHHKNFDKRNNDPNNLVRMDEHDHTSLHGRLQNSVVLMHTPESKEKVLKWLKSDRHRDEAREQLKVLQAQGLMRTSWDEYNASPQAKADNTTRSRLKKEMWSDPDRRAAAKANMAIKFDDKCLDLLIDCIVAHGKHLNPKALGRVLKVNEPFMQHFREINKETKRDLTKSLNTNFTNFMRRVGYESYIDMVSKRIPSIASTPKFITAQKKSVKMSSVAPDDETSSQATQDVPVKLNHKVVSVERLDHVSDVYCMEVLGPNDEHDRHNFAVVGKKNDGTVDFNSGIFIENCKFGDFFAYIDVSAENGIERVFQIPVNEIDREENFDRNDPFAIRYRWNTLGSKVLENWEVMHFRLLGNDMFLPYGSSVLDPARRIWRQLILIEDAMLVYRIVRAPERRVFSIDVGNIPSDEVEAYIQEQCKSLKSQSVVDTETGRADLRYAPLSVSEDYFIAVRGSESGTKIDTLQGGQNAAAIEDVAYIQKKMIASLKVPRAFLGYDEALGSKSTLAAEDIRWARTIAVIQQTIIAELSKIAIVHLTAHGYDGDELLDFSLQLPNPSSIAQQQKLELLRARLEIAGTAAGIEGLTSYGWIRREILEFNREECAQIDADRQREKAFNDSLDQEAGGGGGGGGGGGSLFGGGGGGDSGGGDSLDGLGDDLGDGGGSSSAGGDGGSLGDLGAGGPPPEDGGGADDAGTDEPPEENADDDPAFGSDDDSGILLSGDDPADAFSPARLSTGYQQAPIKPSKHLKDSEYASSRKIRNGPRSDVGAPDWKRSFSPRSDDNKDPFGVPSLKDLVPEIRDILTTKRDKLYNPTRLTVEMRKLVETMKGALNVRKRNAGSKARMLSEGLSRDRFNFVEGEGVDDDTDDEVEIDIDE